MAKRRHHARAERVRHPRYGSDPIPSGLSVPKDELLRGFWRHSWEAMYPESVLIADPSKQNYSVFPRRYYVDVLRECRTCRRRFIFFAREQKHWFETLKFYIDADCVLCPDCRRESQALRRRLRRYSDRLQQQAPSQKDLMLLVDDAAFLLRHGVLHDLHRLGRLKNEALRRIPEYPGTLQLVDTIKRARGIQVSEH